MSTKPTFLTIHVSGDNLSSLIKGAIRSVINDHPEYFTDIGRASVTGSLEKRMFGQISRAGDSPNQCAGHRGGGMPIGPALAEGGDA